PTAPMCARCVRAIFIIAYTCRMESLVRANSIFALPPERRTPKQRRERFSKERPPEESVETPWRLFIAVPVPDDVRDFMGEIIADLKREGWPVRWTNTDNAHLTLHFLGDTPPEHAELLRFALAEPVTR